MQCSMEEVGEEIGKQDEFKKLEPSGLRARKMTGVEAQRVAQDKHPAEAQGIGEMSDETAGHIVENIDLPAAAQRVLLMRRPPAFERYEHHGEHEEAYKDL